METVLINPECSSVTIMIPQVWESKFQILKNELNIVKNKFGKYNKNTSFENKKRNYDAAHSIRNTLRQSLGEPKLNNAWVKFWELCQQYPSIWKQNNYTIFHNAALPGSSIRAVHHFISNNEHNSRWWASSYITNRPKGVQGPNADILGYKVIKDESLLTDQYGLLKNHASKWYIPGDGDVRKIENINEWGKRFKNQIHVYFSDLGHECKDLDEQESEHSHAHLGQVLAGLETLVMGGSMIFKLFTVFESFTIGMLLKLCDLFEKVHLCKPIASRTSNSEIYVVCISFTPYDVIEGKRNTSSLQPKQEFQDLRNRMKKNGKFDNGSFDLNGSNGDIGVIYNFIKKIKEQQINAMEDMIGSFKFDQNAIKRTKERINQDIFDWFQNNQPVFLDYPRRIR
jgi:23S rRNA U2552 (ribose-2'-O)-methylase RlmE/FtsJ